MTGWGATEVTRKRNSNTSKNPKGYTYNYKYPDVLQILGMTILDGPTCERQYFPRDVKPSHEFCAETKVLSKSTCMVSINRVTVTFGKLYDTKH